MLGDQTSPACGANTPQTPQEEGKMLSKSCSERPNCHKDRGKKRRLKTTKPHLPPVNREDEMGH